MSESKIEIKIGEIKFSGEGEQEWLSKQLDKILEKSEDLIKLAPAVANSKNQNHTIEHQVADFSNSSEISSQSLVSFLKSKNVTVAQVDKFLDTSIWLEAKEKKTRLKTSDISSALKNASQTKLNNPSDTLNQNVGKGFFEKDGKEYFVTQEGKDHMNV